VEPAPLLADGPPTVVAGRFEAADAHTYRVHPVSVPAGVHRLEVAYSWSPEHDTVLDLGLWDSRGYRSAAGFRGWSGSRQGRLHQGESPVWVADADADRCYTPGPIEPGTWWVELGAGALAEHGCDYRIEVAARTAGAGLPPAPDPVDSAHIARAAPGWYHGDFHQHGHHSNPRGPTWEEAVDFSRAAGLEILPLLEYVVGRHWDELGAVQRAHPDLLLWPSREVITYFGHAVILGETPGALEYRHGFEDVSIGAIQRVARDAGALFQVAHPTIYPPELFGAYCRGCYFSLGAEIDWDGVDTMEVVTGPVWVEPGGIENPFVDTAIDFWHDRLRAGHRITAISGSDDKLGPDYGSSATAVRVDRLDRASVLAALRSGHAYVRARGVHGSPELDLRAGAPDGTAGTFGDTLPAARADVEVTVRGGAGQELRVLRDGEVVDVVAVRGDDIVHRFEAAATAGSGPLGTFWGVETRGEQGLTALANPVFLRPGGAFSEEGRGRARR
jgi:hypothetical protein